MTNEPRDTNQDVWLEQFRTQIDEGSEVLKGSFTLKLPIKIEFPWLRLVRLVEQFLFQRLHRKDVKH